MIGLTLASLSLVSLIALFSDGISQKKFKFLYYFLALCLIFVAGFRNGESMPDYASYAGYYSYVIEGQFSYFIEISFTLIVKLANLIIANNSTLMFLVYAFLEYHLSFTQ